MNAAQVANALGGAKQHGSNWSACCPAHDDRRPSLSLDDAEDGKLLYHCRAGCSQEQVRAALLARGLLDKPEPKVNGHDHGLNGKANGAAGEAKSTPLGRIVATYDYVDANGELLFQVIRYDPKDFRQRRPDGNRGWVWKVQGIDPVPYRLPELMAAPLSETVFIPEGEKDVDNVRKIGLVATCNPRGKGNWSKELARYFKGRNVVLLADNDEAGRDHVRDVEAKLRKHATSIVVVELPGLPPKGDVSNWLDAGGTVDELHALVEEARAKASGAQQKCDGAEDDWGGWPGPDPDELRDKGAPDKADDDLLRAVKLSPIGRTKIPPRPWAYGTFMLFGHAAVLGAVDGGGKGSMAVAMTLAIITGKPLLGEKVWRKGPVAIITYEDSLDEWHRRIAAACLHYDLDYEYVLDNVIFLTKNRGRIRLAAMSQDGIVFPDSEAIIAALKEADARLLIIDPFNHAHDTEDGNNNLIIAKVAGETERIAREACVAALALHHLRKGSVGHVDDLMGATSLRATFRSTRILTRMTEEEGKKIGVTQDVWRYSRIGGTKENYSPPPDKSTWFQLKSVDLGNTEVDETYPGGDQVQVTVPWTPPPLFEGLDRAALGLIFYSIKKGPSEGEHYSPVRKSKRWVGNLIIGAGEGEGKTAEQAASIVATWLKSNLLIEDNYRSPASRKIEQMVTLDEAKAAEILGSAPVSPVEDVDL